MKKFLILITLLFSFTYVLVVNAEGVPTLEQIAKTFNNNSTVKSYKEAGSIFKASADKGKIVVNVNSGDIKCKLNFNLEGNILTSKELSSSEASLTQAVAVMFITDAVQQFYGYKEGEIYPTLNSDESQKFTIAKNGFEYKDENEYTIYKIDISKKIKLLDFSNVYIKEKDLENAKEYITGDGFTSGSYGNIYYSQDGYDNEKEIIIAEKPKLTKNTYKSLISILSVIFNEDIVSEFKNKYENIDADINFLGIKVEINPEIDESEKETYEGYKLIKASLNIKDVKKEYKKYQKKQKKIKIAIGCGIGIFIVAGILVIVKRKKNK